MKCPYCNEDMKMGYIQSARPMFWGEKKRKLFWFPRREEEVEITKNPWDNSAEAYYCAKCENVIIKV